VSISESALYPLDPIEKPGDRAPQDLEASRGEL
jgi:hypothetical protein